MRPSREKTAAIAAAGTAVAAAAGIGIKQLRSSDGSSFDSDAYRLLESEPVGPGIKRVLATQVDDAIAQLRGEAGTEPEEAIHEARKDVKKIRSALRLVRHEIGDEVWRRENDHYRDVARKLSSFRDAEILVEALDGLRERSGPTATERSDGIRKELDEENRSAHDDGSVERAMAGAAAELATGRARVDALPLDGDGWELIAPGLHRSYRRGRKRLRAVEEEASVTNLHELRKRVKDLPYQLRLIRDVDRAMLEPLADHAHGLSDHLGDDHDLALLREEAQRRRNAFARPADQRHLLQEIDQRRGELQFAAISLAERIYAEQAEALHEAAREALGRLARAQAGRGVGCHSPEGYLVSNSADSGKETAMKVFVAGATGAIGKQLVPMLVEGGTRGHRDDSDCRQGGRDPLDGRQASGRRRAGSRGGRAGRGAGRARCGDPRAHRYRRLRARTQHRQDVRQDQPAAHRGDRSPAGRGQGGRGAAGSSPRATQAGPTSGSAGRSRARMTRSTTTPPKPVSRVPALRSGISRTP